MGMVPVGCDAVIVRPAHGKRAHRHRLLSDVQMQKPADFARLIGFQRTLLETADAQHLTQEVDLALGRQRLIHRGVIIRPGHNCGAWRILGFSFYCRHGSNSNWQLRFSGNNLLFDWLKKSPGTHTTLHKLAA